MSDDKPLIIGEPTGPVHNTLRRPRVPASDVKVETAVKEEAESVVAAALEKPKPLTPADKAKAYLDGLAAVGSSQEEARLIMDCVLSDGEYAETFQISPDGRCPIVLRTRDYTDTQRMLRIAEAEAPQLPTHYNDIMARCNMAAALVSYRDREFKRPQQAGMSRFDYHKAVEDAFHERLDFIMTLPTPIVNKIMSFLSVFDQKIFAVFADGAPSDF